MRRQASAAALAFQVFMARQSRKFASSYNYLIALDTSVRVSSDCIDDTDAIVVDKFRRANRTGVAFACVRVCLCAGVPPCASKWMMSSSSSP